MVELHLDTIQTAGIGALALVLGMWLTRKFAFLKRFCIPSPVSGGILFSLLTLALYSLARVEVSFDGTLKDIFMVAFFTSVGFQTNLKVMKQGGRLLVMLVLLLVMIIVMQNTVALAIAKALGLNPLIGVAAGSISMVGGHGTAGGFSGLLESMGLTDASTIAMAAATFGLIAGSMIGGPMAERIISKRLAAKPLEAGADAVMPAVEPSENRRDDEEEGMSASEVEFQHYAKATYSIILVMAGGTMVSWLLEKTGVTFPTYFGALVLAVVARNVMGLSPRMEKHLDMDRIVSVGNICLSMFLGMAMVSLKLWELQSLALPLILILLCQVVLLALFAYFIAFWLLGRSYDAAVLVAGICGFGLGATPNAMANMSAVCHKYCYTIKPFLLIPIVGGMFNDVINTGIITMFLNFIGG